jgi:hypothetical protein
MYDCVALKGACGTFFETCWRMIAYEAWESKYTHYIGATRRRSTRPGRIATRRTTDSRSNQCLNTGFLRYTAGSALS